MGIVSEPWGRGKGLVTTSPKDNRRNRGWIEVQLGSIPVQYPDLMIRKLGPHDSKGGFHVHLMREQDRGEVGPHTRTSRRSSGSSLRAPRRWHRGLPAGIESAEDRPPRRRRAQPRSKPGSRVPGGGPLSVCLPATAG